MSAIVLDSSPRCRMYTGMSSLKHENFTAQLGTGVCGRRLIRRHEGSGSFRLPVYIYLRSSVSYASYQARLPMRCRRVERRARPNPQHPANEGVAPRGALNIEPESLRLAQGHDNVSSPMIGVSHRYMDYGRDIFVERTAISAGLMPRTRRVRSPTILDRPSSPRASRGIFLRDSTTSAN